MIVFLSGVSMELNQLLWPTSAPEAIFGLRTHSIFHLTSSLVNSRPECQVTPLRRFSLICRESELTSQLSASIGCGFEVWSYSMRRSNGAQLTLPVLSRC